jgi:hypothetical protein
VNTRPDAEHAEGGDAHGVASRHQVRLRSISTSDRRATVAAITVMGIAQIFDRVAALHDIACRRRHAPSSITSSRSFGADPIERPYPTSHIFIGHSLDRLDKRT